MRTMREVEVANANTASNMMLVATLACCFKPV